MQATRIAKARRRRRGAARAPRRDRARGADLDDLLGLASGELRTPALADRDPRLDHPARGGRGARRRGGRVPRSTTCSAPSEAFLASTVREVQPVAAIDDRRFEPGPRTERGARGVRRRRSPQSSARRSGMPGVIDAHRRAAADRRDRARLRRQRGRARAPATPTARERFDLELARRLGEMGYLGAPVAEEYGGRGLDYLAYGLIVEEVGRGDSAMRTVVSVQTSLVCGSIERWGTEEQKQRWLPGLCLGRGVRLLRADRARHRLRRGQPAHPRREDRRRLADHRAARCGSRSATSPRSR